MVVGMKGEPTVLAGAMSLGYDCEGLTVVPDATTRRGEGGAGVADALLEFEEEVVEGVSMGVLSFALETDWDGVALSCKRVERRGVTAAIGLYDY